MKPAEFYPATSPGAGPHYFPAEKSPEEYVVAVWPLSFRERVQLLFGGRLYSSLETRGNRAQRLKLSTAPEEVAPGLQKAIQ